MDFSLKYTEKQEEFAKCVREWINKNVPKDLPRVNDSAKVSREQWERRREIGHKLGEKGWLLAGYPREYGGADLDIDHRWVLHREFERARISIPPYYDSGLALGAPAVMATGTEEQKRRFLPPMAKGEVITWELFTEPEAGTDEANQQTNALRHRREGDYFVLNGQKIFVGSIYSPPNQFLLLTRSDPEAPRHENLAMFLSPANLQGITIIPLDLYTAGSIRQVWGASADSMPGQKNQVFFDDVRVHESYLIGDDHDGWKVANATLTVEHGTAGSLEVRMPQENFLVDNFLKQCRSNPSVVKRLKENSQLLEGVVNIHVGGKIQRLWEIRNFWLQSSRRQSPGTGPQLSLYSKMFGARLIADMAKVLGPYAFVDDTEWCLEDGIFEVAERCANLLAPGGTPEAHKIIISRALRIGR